VDDEFEQAHPVRLDRYARIGPHLLRTHSNSISASLPVISDRSGSQADVVSIAPDVSGFVDDLKVKDNQFVHKGDVLLVLDRERYSRALAMAEANVAARKAEMDMRQHEAARRAKLTSLMRSEQTRSASFALPMQLGRRSWCRCAMVACGNPLSPSTVALQPSWQPIWPIRSVSGIHVQGAATAIRWNFGGCHTRAPAHFRHQRPRRDIAAPWECTFIPSIPVKLA
jgi:hypothetical protein